MSARRNNSAGRVGHGHLPLVLLLDFLLDGANTVVRVDQNGGMDNATILATLLNVQLLETDTANFIVSNV